MAPNFPGPYEIRLNYDATPPSGVKTHQLRISCFLENDPDIGDPISGINAIDRGGDPVSVETWVDGLVDRLAVRYTSTANFNTAELWRYAPGTFNADWITQWVVDIPGTSGSPAVDDSQTIFTFRTTQGGYGKLDLRSSISAASITVPFPTGTASFDDIADYMSDPNTIAVGRDNGYFVVAINLLQGFNEKMFKRRLRP